MIRVLLFALLFAAPAMADNFSNNQSGVSSCTIDIVGSSSTPITATANYSPITYNCAAGTYLPADAIECATCLAGYYCPGGDYAFNELNASGLNACPGARPSSNPGNSSQNNCYTPCASDKIDAGLDGTNCQTPKFTVTTTNVSTGTEFKFYMSASGTFYVDCGAGGTLSGTGVTNNTITRNDTTEALYTCTYSTAGTKTIRFAGLATDYKTNASTPAILFGINGSVAGTTPTLITSISGNMSSVFPYISTNSSSGNSAQPRFCNTFNNATNLTTISSTLFADYTIPSSMMFAGLFGNCTSLTTIPTGLFSSLRNSSGSMFSSTFSGCTSLTTIPADLFSNISHSNGYMFYRTFANCTSLTTIPNGLFSSIRDSTYNTFNETFFGCTSLTTIPANLFSGITTGAAHMFDATFANCTSLITIPSGLFSSITTSADYMFYQTFYNCSALQNIPSNLFAGLTTGSDFMFFGVFSRCSALTTIPDGLFSRITTGAESMFRESFWNCRSLTTIPSNLFAGITTGAVSMFRSTFNTCTSLVTIPDGLFSNVTTGANDMFDGTFHTCSSLTTIPSNLFSGIISIATDMFSWVFANCTSLTTIPNELFSHITDSAPGLFQWAFDNDPNLSGYISPSVFAGLIANNSPTATNMWYNAFTNTNLATTCPSGMTQYITGYEDYWSGKVSCVDANLTCSAGNYLPAHGYECTQCTANNYCVGGTYPYSATESHGITPCDTGYSSAAGASSCTPNTINIQWDDGNGGYTAGTCTYGGSITTPTTAPTKRGHVFTGWTFDLN